MLQKVRTYHSFGSESMSGWEDDAAAPPPLLGAGHQEQAAGDDIACWGTAGPHRQGPRAAYPSVVSMEAGGAGKQPGMEGLGCVRGNLWTDGEPGKG